MLAQVEGYYLPNVEVQEIQATEEMVTVRARIIEAQAACPTCNEPSRRVQSRYYRRLRDLPSGGRAVRLVLQVRRFTCGNSACARKVFAERLPALTSVRAQRTNRLRDSQQALAVALGGEAGARLSRKIGMGTSPDTLLRLIRRATIPTPATPRVLGVDDWAFRRGKRYGTVLVDLERHCPVDLLSDRSAETLSNWLRAHPGVRIVSRDRGGEYAHGARQGAPQAVQVADRFHLLKNLSEVLERVLQRHQAALKHVVVPNATGRVVTPRAPRRYRERASQQARERRLARYQAVRDLSAQGMSISAIGRQLGLSRTTVIRFASADTFPERAQRQRVAGMLAPFEPYLRQCWQEGCRNQMALWREIRSQGYTGGYRTVTRFLAQLDASGSPVTVAGCTPRQAVGLVMRRAADLTAEEAQALESLSQVHPEVERAIQLAQQFLDMTRERQADQLDDWGQSVVDSRIPELRRFVHKLQQDRAAVQAGLSLPWSIGQVEGQVNRLKFIKRSMYGRANFDLLRQRVLLPS